MQSVMLQLVSSGSCVSSSSMPSCTGMCLCDAAAGIQSAVAAVSPGGFQMLLQRPGSIPPEMLASMEQQRRAAPPQAPQQHVTSLGSRVRALLTTLCIHRQIF